MGASDSKLVYKKAVFRLSEEKHIPADDPYWTSFWELPESAEDVFSLFSPADIRRTRDKSIENLETLILAVTSRLFHLRHHPSFPDPDLAPERDALNCVRVLSRVLPYVYEKESLQEWEDRILWTPRRKRVRKPPVASEVLFDEGQDEELARQELGSPAEPEDFEDTKPLAGELIDTLIDLLFFSDLTVAKQPSGRPKVSYAIWQSGVGCNSAVQTTKEYESNRCEIVRLLLALTGQSLYFSPTVLPQRGVKSLTYICTCPDKQTVLSMLCSLLNTTLKYNPASWRVPYNTLVFKDPKQVLVTYTLQLLLVILLYSIPAQEASNRPKNYYRHFLGRLHRPQDFQFIVDGITRILHQPLQANASYIPATQDTAKLAPEILMLFWEITQSNKRFRAFIVDTERAHDFTILVLFHALDSKNDAAKQGVVRMCTFLLQTLSVEQNFGINLNRTFKRQETLPPVIRINGFRGTYADFLIQSIYTLITTSKGKLTAIYPALLAVINNIAAHLEGLNGMSCTRLMQLFNSISSPSFLLANETNHGLLRSLLESMSAVVEHKYNKNPEFAYAALKNKKRFDALRSLTLESGQEEAERLRRRRQKDPAVSLDPLQPTSSRSSIESGSSLATPHARRAPVQHDVDRDDTFAVGEDDDSDDEDQPTPAPSSPSRTSSVASQQDDDVPRQLRGMSEKARGKMPAGSPRVGHPGRFANNSETFSSAATGNMARSEFQPSAHWIESWLPELPLHTMLSLLSQLGAVLPKQAVVAGHSAPVTTLNRIQEVQLVGIEPSPVRVHLFEWSPQALGWYEALLWGFVFTSEMQVTRGTVGVWNGTAIKLFRVQETAPQGPTLTSPRGAVDAVGSNLVSRIGAMNLRGAPSASTSVSENGSGPAPPTAGRAA